MYADVVFKLINIDIANGLILSALELIVLISPSISSLLLKPLDRKLNHAY